jgi:hypothetical protein
MFGQGIGVLPQLIATLYGYPARPVELVDLRDDVTALMLTPGRSVYVEQLVELRHPSPWRLTAKVRRTGMASLEAFVCKKTLLHSFQCLDTDIGLGRHGDNWQPVEQMLDVRTLTHPTEVSSYCPTTFALSASGADGRIEIAELKLNDAEGQPVLRNPDFRSGSTGWYFTSDNYAIWRVENRFVHLFDEQGWFGVTSFVWLVGVTLMLLIRALIRAPDQLHVVLGAAILGFLAMGFFGTLIDTPWLLELFCTLLGVTQGVAMKALDDAPTDGSDVNAV